MILIRKSTAIFLTIIFTLTFILTMILSWQVQLLKEKAVVEVRYEPASVVFNGEAIDTATMPLRIKIEYTYPDKTTFNMWTYDNMVDTGNDSVDRAITEYLRQYRQRTLVCNCEKPVFSVHETNDGITIIVQWPEFIQFLHVGE